jgi:hypothetical protein
MVDEGKNKRNRLILFAIAIGFTIFVIITLIDIMGRTTRPGAKKHLPNSILK